MIDAPVIETERLRLRGPDARDADAFEAHFASGRARFQVDAPAPGCGWRVLAANIGHWTMRGYGGWVATLRGDDRAIGLVGPWHPGNWPEIEIGWCVFEGFEGSGIAAEAAREARAFCRRRYGWTTLVSYVDAANARSIRLAERLGCRRDPDAATPNGRDVLVFRHPDPEHGP